MPAARRLRYASAHRSQGPDKRAGRERSAGPAQEAVIRRLLCGLVLAGAALTAACGSSSGVKTLFTFDATSYYRTEGPYTTPHAWRIQVENPDQESCVVWLSVYQRKTRVVGAIPYYGDPYATHTYQRRVSVAGRHVYVKANASMTMGCLEWTVTAYTVPPAAATGRTAGT